MKNYQEAFNCLFLEIQNTYISDDVDLYDEAMSHFIPSLNLIRELVDRDTPMKPESTGSDFAGKLFRCGNCRTFERYTNPQFKKRCDGCGQKIDWSAV